IAWPRQRGDLTHEYFALSSIDSIAVFVPLVPLPSTKLASVTPSNGCRPLVSLAYLYQLWPTNSWTCSGSRRSTGRISVSLPPMIAPRGIRRLLFESSLAMSGNSPYDSRFLLEMPPPIAPQSL